MTVEIRALHSYEEMLAVQQVHRRIWTPTDGTAPYPPSLLSFAENGGLVLGAFEGASGPLVAFCFGYLGRHWDGQLKLYSQTMGVLPDYRGRGVAYRLKCMQREWALAQGLKLITWTYDPLEMPNAHLNIARLGAIVRRYKRNLYGESFGQINSGLPSDRFVAEWRLERPEVAARLAGERAPSAGEAERVDDVEGSGRARRIVQYNLDASSSTLRVEVLSDLQATKAYNLALARDWRLKTRELFETYFAKGYAVTGFAGQGAGEDRRNWYLLTHAGENSL